MSRSSNKWLYSLIAVLTSACAASRSMPPGSLSAPRTDVLTSSAGPWAFAHSPGTRAYRTSRVASIEGLAESASRREIVSNFTHQVLTLEPAGEEIRFTAVVDTFTLTTQGIIGPAQTVELPFQLSGTMSPTGIRIEAPANGACNAARATVATDLYNLLIPLPSRLSKGATWRDSTVVSGCQAGIPTTTTTKRLFAVSGEVVYSGQAFLLITRVDSITARGEGGFNQHRMLVQGRGAGSARYYLDTTTGEVAQLLTSQSFLITVTSSDRAHPFTQIMNQEFVRVR